MMKNPSLASIPAMAHSNAPLHSYAAQPNKPKRALGLLGPREELLNQKFEALALERFAALAQANMFACDELRAQEILGTMHVLLRSEKSLVPEKVYHSLFRAKHRPYEREECFSFSNLILQAQARLLGEDAFLERQWSVLAAKTRQADESLRLRLGLPKPAGLGARQEGRELDGCAQAAPSSRARRAL